ncbi:MAG: hypothetical protein KIH08_17330 [Candidatus Freyarchaeota archaeon]|nr:hypothetical protein [Candidatus Jordarchaeia archaeon]
MSELTYMTGEIQECPFCTFKHLTDAEQHSPPDIKPLIQKLREDLAKKIDIDKASYDEVRKYEHILEDYLTVLREKRKEIEPHRGCSGEVNPGQNPNPQLAELEQTKCSWMEEKVKPKEYFHPESFRTLCPECPQARCALCPPEKACASRIIIGCPMDKWDSATKKCKVSTEAHVIYHGSQK